MAEIKVKQYRRNQFGGAPPYGNLTTYTFPLATGAAGGALDANSTAPIAAGDVVVLGDLPGGMRLEDLSILVEVGMTATITGSVGFRYKDGVNSTEVPQDAAYFVSAANLAAAGRVRANTGKLVVLPKDAELILTTAVAANAKASSMKFVVTGELTGQR